MSALQRNEALRTSRNSSDRPYNGGRSSNHGYRSKRRRETRDSKDRIKAMIILIGADDPDTELYTHLHGLSKAIVQEYGNLYELINDAILECATKFPLKSSLYACLVMFCATENSNFKAKFISDLQNCILKVFEGKKVIEMKFLCRFVFHLFNIGFISFGIVNEIVNKVIEINEFSSYYVLIASLPVLRFHSSEINEISDIDAANVAETASKMAEKLKVLSTTQISALKSYINEENIEFITCLSEFALKCVENCAKDEESLQNINAERCFYARNTQMKEFLMSNTDFETINAFTSPLTFETKMKSNELALHSLPIFNFVSVFVPAATIYSEKVRKGRSEDEFPLQGIELAGNARSKVTEIESFLLTDIVFDLIQRYESKLYHLTDILAIVFRNESLACCLVEILFNLALQFSQLGTNKGKRLHIISILSFLTFKSLTEETNVDISTVFDDFIDAFMIILPETSEEVRDCATYFIAAYVHQVYIASNANYTVYVSHKLKNLKKFLWTRWSSLVTEKENESMKVTKRRAFVKDILFILQSFTHTESLQKLIGEEISALLPTSQEQPLIRNTEGCIKVHTSLVEFIKSKPDLETQLNYVKQEETVALLKSIERSLLVETTVKTCFIVGKASLTHLLISFERLFQVFKFIKEEYEDDTKFNKDLLEIIESAYLDNELSHARLVACISILTKTFEIVSFDQVFDYFSNKSSEFHKLLQILIDETVHQENADDLMKKYKASLEESGKQALLVKNRFILNIV